MTSWRKRGGVVAAVVPDAQRFQTPLDPGEMASVGGTEIPLFAAHSLMTRPDSMAGVPAISLPGKLVDGLPTGFQLTGRAGQDRHLLAVAEAIEALLPPRPIPPAHLEESFIG